MSHSVLARRPGPTDKDLSFPGSSILAIALLTLLCTAGCTSLDRKFRGVTVADIGFFADETITILSQADFAFTRDEAVYTREFFDPEGFEEQQHQALVEQAESLFQRIMDYSLGLVEIYQSQSSDQDRVAAYADSLETIDEELLEAINLSRPYFDELVVEVREQKRFIDALRVAQPILNGAGWYMNAILNDLVEVTDAMALRIEVQIDERYSAVIAYQQALRDEKNAVLNALKLVYQTQAGDILAYDELRADGAIRQKGLLPKGAPSNQDLAALTDHLTARLDGLHTISLQIEPMWQLYRTTHVELDQLFHKRLESINETRVLMMVWLGAHYHMATGHRAPAEWFDIGAVPGMAVNTVR